MGRNSILKFLLAGLALATIPAAGQGTDVVGDLNFDATLMNAAGTPRSGTVDLKFQILDVGGNCLMYEEVHNFSIAPGDAGNFSRKIGGGLRTVNDSGYSMRRVFTNKPFPSVAGCSGGYVPNAGDRRKLRVFVDSVALIPDYDLSSAPTALVAGSVQGLEPADILQSRVDANYALSQSNLMNVFSTVNYPKLTDLLNGTGQYLPATPTAAVSMNNQRVVNIAAPTAATDAASKGYTDSFVGGKDIDFAGVGPATGDGKAIVWNQAANRWEAQTLSTTDNTKLPLAGGAMTGTLNMSANDITNTGYISQSANKYLSVSQRSADPGGLSAGHAGAMWYDYTNNLMKYWNGSAVVPMNGGAGAITALTGDVTASGAGSVMATISNASITNAKIANDSVDAHKLSSTDGLAINRLVMTDGTTGTDFNYKTCANNEILQYTVATGWVCQSLPAAPVASVAGKTGAVALNTADIAGLGTAATRDFGTAANQIVSTDATAKIPASVLPDDVFRVGGNGQNANLDVGSNLAYDVNFRTQALTRMSIKSSGFVGIGTTTPIGLLHVEGGPVIVGAQGSGAGQGGKIVMREPTSFGTNFVALRAPDNITTDYTLTLPAADGANGNFLTTNGAGQLAWTPGPSLAASTSANGVIVGSNATPTGTQTVAIGTNAGAGFTGANAVLVGNNAAVSGGAGQFNTILGSSAGSTNAVNGNGNTMVGYNTMVGITVANSLAIGKSASVTGTNGVAIGPNTVAPADTIVLGITTTERLRIDATGKIGIGTTVPTVSMDIGARNDAIRIPRGTSAQRPASPASGDMRFNTDLSEYEVFRSGAWLPLEVKVPAGVAQFNTPGSYGWTVPANVTRVKVTAIGGGGAGCSGCATEKGGDGAGGYAFVDVVPGANITVVVGAPGTYSGGNGGSTTFDGTVIVANGGAGAAMSTPGTNGSFTTSGAPFVQAPGLGGFYGAGMGIMGAGTPQSGKVVIEW